MNTLSGTIAIKDGTAGVETEDGTRLPLANGLGDVEGKEVFYGLRPEHFALADDAAEGAIRATVSVVEPTGSETLVICRMEGQELQVVFQERQQLHPGQAISLMPSPGTALLFDNGSGERIR